MKKYTASYHAKIAAYMVCCVSLALCAGCASSKSRVHRNMPRDVWRTFVGTWEGDYLNSDGQIVRSWVQHRLHDGTYSIVFVLHTKKALRKFRQKGKWWIEGNKFYEIAPDIMDEPDVYEFDILNHDEIHFRSTTSDYQFIDKRVRGMDGPTFI